MNSTPQKGAVVNDKTLRVGIDMSMKSFTWRWRCPDRTTSEAMTCSNTSSGFQELWDEITAAQTRFGLSEVAAAIESTGSYGEPLAHYLSGKPVRLVQINPKHTKRLKELRDNSPNKTDDKDPFVIVDIMELVGGLSVLIPRGVYASLRNLTGLREQLLRRRTGIYGQVHAEMAACFPEFIQQVKDITIKTARHIMRHYPLPELMAARSRTAIARELHSVSKGRWSQENAWNIYAAAVSSCGVREGGAARAMAVRMFVDDIDRLDGQIAHVEEEMKEQLRQVPYSEVMLSMKGIGPVTAAGILGETGGLHNYHTQTELFKLAGLDLFEISSGKHRGQRHISKRGRAVLRRLLYFAALNMVRRGGLFHAVYTRYIERGKLKNKGLIMVSRKVLATLFAMARDREPYRLTHTGEKIAA